MSVLEVALNLVGKVLGFLPVEARTVVVLPVLFLILLVLGSWLLRYLGPLIGPAAGWLAGKVLRGAGLVMLFPEFLVSTGLRNYGIQPPAICYAYGEVVCGGLDGTDRALRAVLGNLTGDRRARLLLAVLLAAVLVSGNGRCSVPPPQSCVGPAASWWNSITRLVGAPAVPGPVPATKAPGR